MGTHEGNPKPKPKPKHAGKPKLFGKKGGRGVKPSENLDTHKHRKDGK